MSMNHFSLDLQEALWWRPSSQPHIPPAPVYNHNHCHRLLNLNGCGGDDDEGPSELQEQVLDGRMNNVVDCAGGEQEVPELEKHTLFEKALTPSDVGKLNRLVIPKQHAEKCFPLGGESSDKGLILSFEDESGKCWNFRYSYWSSSQSYVLTKGWSRYVKEKRLDAGDVILFERHHVDMDRLFIGWRRRGEEACAAAAAGFPTNRPSCHSYPTNPQSGSAAQSETPVTGNSRTLRLFGVNMECRLDESDKQASPEGSSLSSHGLGQHQPMYYHHQYPSHQMGIAFAQDINYQQQIRDRRG
ncbi:hypothetical protein SAY87_018717 [Trapa incisa]|uniref:TF-B3 domain-containing protein n=1 Tax=Trapa incisa TaxID=236973 RepID=A0AAN7K274_9MYRT|nr:hypothetical protein SAY87_018717 [Trapa incisa]